MTYSASAPASLLLSAKEAGWLNASRGTTRALNGELRCVCKRDFDLSRLTIPRPGEDTGRWFLTFMPGVFPDRLGLPLAEDYFDQCSAEWQAAWAGLEGAEGCNTFCGKLFGGDGTDGELAKLVEGGWRVLLITRQRPIVQYGINIFRRFDCRHLRVLSDWKGELLEQLRINPVAFGDQLFCPRFGIALDRGLVTATFTETADPETYLKAIVSTLLG